MMLVLSLVGVLLLTPGLARAACVWVLWESNVIAAPTISKIETAWSITETFESKSECSRAAALIVAAWREKGHQRNGDNLIIDTKVGKEPVKIMRGLSCYPDTLDPRGPKTN
jgi:hypothetical protein